MIDTKERNRRQAAHDEATEAWAETGRYSRTFGLADMISSVVRHQAIRKATPPEVRALKQQHHKTRLREAYQRALAKPHAWNCRHLDRSRYFPHQSERERTRGSRKAV